MNCSVPGCENHAVKRSLCGGHYRRYQRHGDVMAHIPLRAVAAKGEPMAWILEHKDYSGEGCLEWPFYSKPDGYASMFEGNQTTNACHVMCREAHGEPPTPTHEAAHSCGNGHLGCVHPEHLRWATHQENGIEAVVHGRHPVGEGRPNSKLTRDDVIAIRRSAASGVSHRDLAEQYGISSGQVSLIRNGKRWGWLKEGLAA